MRWLLVVCTALSLSGCGDGSESAAIAEEAWESARSANARAEELEGKVEELEARIDSLEAETL